MWWAAHQESMQLNWLYKLTFKQHCRSGRWKVLTSPSSHFTLGLLLKTENKLWSMLSNRNNCYCFLCYWLCSLKENIFFKTYLFARSGEYIRVEGRCDFCPIPKLEHFVFWTVEITQWTINILSLDTRLVQLWALLWYLMPTQQSCIYTSVWNDCSVLWPLLLAIRKSHEKKHSTEMLFCMQIKSWRYKVITND